MKKPQFLASPFWDTVPGVLIQWIFIWPVVWVLLFPVYCVTVLYLSIRSLVKRENIDP